MRSERDRHKWYGQILGKSTRCVPDAGPFLLPTQQRHPMDLKLEPQHPTGLDSVIFSGCRFPTSRRTPFSTLDAECETNHYASRPTQIPRAAPKFTFWLPYSSAYADSTPGIEWNAGNKPTFSPRKHQSNSSLSVGLDLQQAHRGPTPSLVLPSSACRRRPSTCCYCPENAVFVYFVISLLSMFLFGRPSSFR